MLFIYSSHSNWEINKWNSQLIKRLRSNFWLRLRASSHEPGWTGWPVYRDHFRFGFIWEISARFPRWKKAKDPGDQFWRETREPKQTWHNTKIITFAPTIALATLKAVSLQLNGMLGLWCGKHSRQCRTTPSGPSRIHPAFIWVTGLKRSYGKISTSLTEIPVGKTEISETEPAHPLIWTTHQKFYTGFRGKARSRKPG